jgi:hypothetical protein
MMPTYSEIYKKLMLLESSSERDPEDPNTWSEEEQIKYVQKKYDNIKDIKTPSERVQLAAVLKNPRAIIHIDSPAVSVQTAVVKKNPELIQKIKNPAESVQLLALRLDPDVYFRINNPSEKAILEVLPWGHSLEDAVEILKNKASKEFQKKAIEKLPTLIKYVEDPDEDLAWLAVRNSQDVGIMEHIKNPSKELQIYAIKKFPNAAEWIDSVDEDVFFYLADERPDIIRFVANPSEKAQMKALEKNLNLIYYIYEPSPFVASLRRLLEDDSKMSRHQKMAIILDALEKSNEYPFLLDVLKQHGWA